VRRVVQTLGMMIALLVAACASGLPRPEAMGELQLTWYNARVAFPDALGLGGGAGALNDPAVAARLAGADKQPVVIYMHGCTGIEGPDRALIKDIAQAGFVVVAPDSMARRYRPYQCSTWDKRGGYNLFVFDFRQAEINYAIQELYQTGWADLDNLFLVGVSEGGLAVAHYRGDMVRARVITQWTCHGSTLVRGISAPEETPILAIVRGDDPWYTGKDSKQRGDCGAYFGDRPGSRSIVLEKGSDHNGIKDDEMVAEITRFLKQKLGR